MNLNHLKTKLSKIDKKSYKAYREIEGIYEIEKGFQLSIDHVQGDPFATPSKLRIIADIRKTQFPEDLYSNSIRKLAFQDYILREFKKSISKYSKKRGTGKSGLFIVDGGGQKVLPRSGCELLDLNLEIRFFAGLPAFGRRIDAHTAEIMLTEEIPKSIKVLKFSYHDREKINEFVNLIEDQEFIRKKLEEKKLVAFIGNDAILPRKSGVEDTPLEKNVVRFKSPESLEVEFETLHHGKIKGMGIPEGVTLIVGGGFHGKSTLLNALSHGIYNHIPNDGREWVISHPSTVKVRSEDGRAITGVDISPFISELPGGKDTKFFTTENASGSTSISANIIEALEIGAKVLLVDEDTSATNFLIRDYLIQKLIPKEKEPITPFIDKVKILYKEYGVSTVLVIGGSGEYLEVADHVISLENYEVFDRTEEAKEIVKNYKIGRIKESVENFGNINKRIILTESFNPKKGKKEKVKSKGLKEIIFGKEVIDVSFVEQIVDDSQTRLIGEIIKYYWKYISPKRKTLREGLEEIFKKINEKGFRLFYKVPPGNFALPRIFEVASAINRLRTLKVIHDKGD